MNVCSRFPAWLALVLALAPFARAADDWGDLWLTFNSASIGLTEAVDTRSEFEVRLTDTEKAEYVRFSQKFFTRLDAGWQLGTHPVIENLKNRRGWNATYRLDLELNPPKFTPIKNGPTIGLMNRWEMRWREGQGDEIFNRIHQKTTATWKIKAGPFTSYAIANSVFYETDKGIVTMDRIFPVMLGVNHGEKLRASYYLLYQAKRTSSASDWSGAYILGASFSL